MTSLEPQPPSTQSKPRALNILGGILLLIPAMLACAVSQLVPTIGTFIASLQKINLVGPSQFIGLDNYSAVFTDKAVAGAFGFTLQAILVRLLVVAIVPVLLALGASWLGRGARIGLRVLFTIPIVSYVPVATAVMWSLMLSPRAGLFREPLLGQPAQAQQILLLMDGVYMLGLACGLALVFHLAALRNFETGQSPWQALGITWVIGLLAATASGLQFFALSLILTNGGPATATTSLVFYLYKVSFQFLRVGYGSAIAVLLLIILGLLGLVATALAVFSGLKIRLLSVSATKTAAGGPQTKSSASMALIVAMLVSLAAALASLMPLLLTVSTAMQKVDAGRLLELMPIGSTLLNTLVPPLISVLFIQAPIAYLGALGIGALRPLGRHSEWLLLPFAAWLFVGMAPLSLSLFQAEQQIGLLNTFVALIPPVGVSIPMLVLLTLFFRGQQAQFHQAQSAGASTGRAFLTRLILPSLPLLVVLACGSLFWAMQDPFWGLIAANKSALFPADNVLLAMRSAYASQPSLIANAVLLTALPGALFFFVVFAVFQIFYLDRLSISTGPD